MNTLDLLARCIGYTVICLLCPSIIVFGLISAGMYVVKKAIDVHNLYQIIRIAKREKLFLPRSKNED